MIDLTISIVSYNAKDLLKKCLTSIFEQIKDITFEVFVIDNASKDGSAEMVKKEFLKVKLIANKDNRFYTKANNQSLKLASGKYFLILNCDTFFIDNSIKKMVDYLEKNPKVGALEGLQLYLDKVPIPTGSEESTVLLDFYTLSWLGNKIINKEAVDQYKKIKLDRKQNWEASVVCDAFIMLPTKVFRDINGYDENLLLYYTENDLCKRVLNSGFKVIHFGEAKMMHSVNASSQKLGRKKINKIYLEDLKYYYQKWGKGFWGNLLYYDLKTEYKILELLKKFKD